MASYNRFNKGILGYAAGAILGLSSLVLSPNSPRADAGENVEEGIKHPPKTPAEAAVQSLENLVIDYSQKIPETFAPIKDIPILHADTEHYDITTSLGKDNLDLFVKTAEKTRGVLENVLGIEEEHLSIRHVKQLICKPSEYRGILEKVGVSKESLDRASNVSTYFRDGIFIVAPTIERKVESLDKYIQSIAGGHISQDPRFSVPGKGLYLHPWLMDSVSLFTSSIINNSTLSYATVEKTYGGGSRKFETKEEMFTGFVFNPKYCAAMIKAGKDEDLRLLIGKQYDTLTAEDNIKGYFFLKYLIEERDKEHSRLGPWLKSEVDGIDMEESLRKNFNLTDNKPAYEEMDKQFRDYFLKAYPVTETKATTKPAKPSKPGRK